MAGVILLTLLATNVIPACHDGSLSFRETFGGFVSKANSDKSILFRHREFFEILFLIFAWGLFLSVCGLLITSVSIISPLANRQRNLRAKKPFLRELFDPASPVSLIPVVGLELIALMTVSVWTEPFRRYMSFRDLRLHWIVVRILWTAIHFGLVFAYIRQRRKPEMKDPWNSHVTFNMACIIGGVAVALFRAEGLNLARSGSALIPVSLSLYVISIIVLVGVFGMTYFRSRTKRLASTEVEQNKEAS